MPGALDKFLLINLNAVNICDICFSASVFDSSTQRPDNVWADWSSNDSQTPELNLLCIYSVWFDLFISRDNRGRLFTSQFNPPGFNPLLTKQTRNEKGTVEMILELYTFVCGRLCLSAPHNQAAPEPTLLLRLNEAALGSGSGFQGSIFVSFFFFNLKRRKSHIKGEKDFVLKHIRLSCWHTPWASDAHINAKGKLNALTETLPITNF